MSGHKFLLPVIVIELDRDTGFLSAASPMTHIAWVAGHLGTRTQGTSEEDALRRLRLRVCSEFVGQNGRRGKRLMMEFDEEDVRDVLDA